MSNNTNKNINLKDTNKQEVKELMIRNQYLRSNINKMLKMIQEFRNEINDNEEIMDKLCNHIWINDYLSYSYDERPKYCNKCFLYR
jgi:hypothetical protein